MVLSFGGDGTVLETATLEGLDHVPVLGINTGRLGFLSHLPSEGAADAIQGILDGNYIVDSREMLEVGVEGMDLEGGGLALNEVTIHRRDVASMIRMSVHRDGTFVNRYWADGLIVSTATGSTAYSLSCGGPIVHPASQAIVLNPIAPHNLNDRPLVIPSDGVLDIQAEGRDAHLVLTLDTRYHILPAPARFTVRRAERLFCWWNCPTPISSRLSGASSIWDWMAGKGLPTRRHTKPAPPDVGPAPSPMSAAFRLLLFALAFAVMAPVHGQRKFEQSKTMGFSVGTDITSGNST